MLVSLKTEPEEEVFLYKPRADAIRRELCGPDVMEVAVGSILVQLAVPLAKVKTTGNMYHWVAE